MIGKKLDFPQYFDGDLSTNATETLKEYFPFFESPIDKWCIRCSYLVAYLVADGIIKVVKPVKIARIFCFYVVGYIFFPSANNFCQIGWLNYLIYMENISNRFPQSFSSLISTIYGIDTYFNIKSAMSFVFKWYRICPQNLDMINEYSKLDFGSG